MSKIKVSIEIYLEHSSLIFLSSLSFNDLKELKINYVLIISHLWEGLAFNSIGHKLSWIIHVLANYTFCIRVVFRKPQVKPCTSY